MYYYLVDNAKKAEFEKSEAKIKEILINYDVLGEFVFVEHLADVEDLVKAGLEKGFSTVVAVGGDDLVNRVAARLVNQKAALGILPLGESQFTEVLGLGNIKSACEVLAARRIMLMDAGVINNEFFITSILANNSPDNAPQVANQSIFSKLLGGKTASKDSLDNQITISVGDEYEITSPINGMSISNLRPFGRDTESVRQSMIDNSLHLAFSDQASSGDVYNSLGDNIKMMEKYNVSLFHLDNFSILSEKPLFFWADGQVIARTPAELSVMPQSLKIISGRLR